MKTTLGTGFRRGTEASGERRFMTQPSGANSFDDARQCSAAEYLRRAHDANVAGNPVLSMHLYLAAFERSVAEDGAASEAVLAGLREAWSLASGRLPNISSRSSRPISQATRSPSAPRISKGSPLTSWRSSGFPAATSRR